VLRFRALGPLELADSAGAVRLGKGREEAVLAALLVRRGRSVSADELIDDVWGEEPPGTARKALQGHISRLRQRLGRQVVATRRSGYELVVPRGALDVDEVEAALRAEGPTDERRTRLQAALVIWRGEPYAGISGPSVEAERARLEELRATLLEQLGEADLAEDAVPEAVDHLETLVKEHPYREHAYALLMRAFQRSGRQADALAVYHRARGRLVEDLGIDPGDELERVQSQILRGGSAATTAADGHGVAEAVRHLPAPLTRFLGRELELASVVRDLAGHRLVTLVGPGGIGKTRLALEAARQVGPGLGDGAAFVDLSGLSSPSLVVPTIGRALDAEQQSEASALEALLAWVRDRHLLLVLDNFERLLPAAADLAALLAGSPGLRMLVTSRRPLRVRGERVIEVGSIIPPTPPAGRRARPTAAIELFLDRAREASQINWSNPTDLEAIERLCRRLDGIPLAIELVAARTRVLAPRDLERLSLVGGRRAAPALRDLPKRQETLNATVTWSLADVEPSAQRFFRALAIFRGGFTVAAAAAVAGTSEPAAIDALDALLDRSLVHRLGTEPEPRFALYEPIRDLVLDKLAARERAGLQRRHAAWCATFAAQADRGLIGPEQQTWLTRVDAEHNNLRAAMDQALHAGDADVPARIVSGLWWYWQIRGLLSEGRSWAERALELGPDLAAPARAGVLHTRGCLLLYQRRPVEALPILEDSCRGFESASDQRGIALASNWLGVAESDLGHPDIAEAHLERARVAAGVAAEPTVELWASLNLYAVLALRGDLDGALTLVDRAIGRGIEAVDPQSAAVALEVPVWGAWIRGDYDTMLRLAPDAIRAAEDVGDVNLSAAGWGFCAQAQAALGDLAAARVSLDRATGLLRSGTRDRDGTMNALIAAAIYLAAIGEAVEAMQAWGLIEAWERSGGYVPWPPEQEARARLVGSLRARLDPAVAETAFREGQALDPEDPVRWLGDCLLRR
jgi:predicted ATPase/DNA-binding SARP family transcriptional activator